jgi:hypothetical protein
MNTNTTQINQEDLMELHEQDLKEIERIKEMVSQPNDDNLTNPQPFLSFQTN